MHKSIFYALLCLLGIIYSSNGFAQVQEKIKPSLLSVEEAVQQAIGQNPELQSMQKEVEAMKAKVPQGRAWEDPLIGVRLYQVPFKGGLDEASDIDYIVSQKIPFPGKKKAAAEIIYHDYLHHLESLNASGRVLLREVKQNYYSLFAVNQQIEQSKQVEKILKGLVQSAQSKLATGEASSTDALQGQTDLAKLLVEREPLLERKKVLEAKLNQLMAQSAQDAIVLPSKLEIPKWNVKLEELIDIAQLRHPSIKLAEHNVGQKQWGVKAAKREYLPDLNAQLEYVQRPNGSPSSSLGNAWTGEFMINVPLILKKKSKAVEQAKAELASAVYSKSAAKNEVTYKLQETYAKMKAAERILQINKSTLLPQTKQALEANSVTYVTGKSPFFSYLTAARSYRDAELEYWKSYEALATSLFELEEAVGITKEEWAKAPSESQKNLSSLLPESGKSTTQNGEKQ